MFGFFKPGIKNRKFDKKAIMAFNWTVDTLIRAATDLNLSDDIIGDALEELESDYISFIHENSLSWIKEANIIDDNQIALILILRSKIDMIPASLWNPTSYRNHTEWIEIHEISNKILNSLGINKRQVDSKLINPNEILKYYKTRNK